MRDALATPQSKNEGTFSMFNIRSVAQNHAIISNNVEIVNDNWSLDTAAGIYLDKKAKDYGMTRHYAQYATGLVTFTGTDGTTIPGGTIVAAPDYGVRFVTQESTIISQGTATVAATCLVTGPVDNVPEDSVTQIADQLQGVTSVNNEAAFSGGVDREDDDNFRMRIYFKIRYPATSGNVYHYQQWATEVSGVGAVKVFPVWNGGGTVKIVFVNSDWGIPSSDLVNSVQTVVDPVQNQGVGDGIAPIGHVVTVEGVTGTTINVSFTLTFSGSATWSAVETSVKKAIQDYFDSLAKTWDEQENLVVRVSQIETKVLNVEGVIDITGTKINGGTQNISLASNAIPEKVQEPCRKPRRLFRILRGRAWSPESLLYSRSGLQTPNHAVRRARHSQPSRHRTESEEATYRDGLQQLRSRRT